MVKAANPIAKPFLKWAGGKGQLLEQIQKKLPVELQSSGRIKKYFEPFLGGGALFFWLTNRYHFEQIFLYEINSEIVMSYRTIQKEVQRLIKELNGLQDLYLKFTKEKQEKMFYEMRTEYNGYLSKKSRSHLVRRTALLIFLNKTCFNGLYRVNSQGLFNVPFGRYKKPNICDDENLIAVSGALQNAQIVHGDFSLCLEHADSESFVYFDPPYRPISATASFTSYSKNAFGDDEQKRLKIVFDKLAKRNAFVMLSNSDPRNINPRDFFFDELYEKHNIDRLDATRMINCQSDKRGIVKEIIVWNYEKSDCRGSR